MYHPENNAMQKNTKIAMISMFRNEADNIGSMLESVAPYIDYWVLQDNGSTDGTADVVREFFNKHPIPGHLYQVAEGWKGFGWNRDHLIKTCQSLPHGCDWILKMDCDETLVVEPDFDWSVLDDITVHAWNVPVISGQIIYTRCWLYNARLPWAFDHDPCHETVRCDLPDIGHNYQSRTLSDKIHHVGSFKGQSWTVPTKFVTDALILEEKMIREGTMLTDEYHFWYIGKSYFDAIPCQTFPLGTQHRDEYARRAIWYLQQWLNVHLRNNPKQHNEMAYMAVIMMVESFVAVGDIDSAITLAKHADEFIPRRNEHLRLLAEMYQRQRNYQRMLEVTTRMMDPQQVCPFPEYQLFIDRDLYHDTGTMAQRLHQQAQIHQALPEVPVDSYSSESSVESPLVLRPNTRPRHRLFVVDDFYDDPDAVRRFALAQEFHEDLRFYKGLRSTQQFCPDWIRKAFERIIQQPITSIDGRFQITRSQDPQVYHHDLQTWAAMIYLSPDAPLESGTRLHRSRRNRARHADQGQAVMDEVFRGGFYDSTQFDTVDDIGNVYNRLVIMDARHIHSAGAYFGQDSETGRLTHLFFFD